MRGPNKKTLAKNAVIQLNDFRSYLDEIRDTEGNHEMNAAAIYPPTVNSMRRHTNAIIAFDRSMMPEWIVKNSSYYKAIGWLTKTF